MAYGLPSVNISFTQKGATAINRGNRGIVALILKDTENHNIQPCTIYDSTDIPSNLEADNKTLILNALKGYTNAPSKLELYVVDTSNTLDKALEYFDGVQFDYLAYPQAEEDDKTEIETFIKKLRDTDGIKCKGVLANKASNHEGIVNVTQGNVVVGEKTYNAGEFTARVAGLLAGTDLRISCTYADMPEVTSIPYEKRESVATKIGKGEFVLFKEAGSIKVARGVNSLTSTTSSSEAKGESFKKIKIIDIMDLMSNDIRKTARESYLGKYANSYDNKCMLISAIDGYMDNLINDGLIEANSVKVDIDLDSQTAYLKTLNVDVNSLTEKEIREYNTQDKVFIKITCKIVDAVEDINIAVTV